MTRALLALRGITRRLRDIPGAVIFMDPIRSRFLIQDRTIVVPDFDGELELEVSLGGHMGSQIFWYGSYSRHILKVLHALLSPGMTVVDVGANLGEITLAAARRVGPTGRVISFEPVDAIADRLQRNVERNHLSQVTIHRTGLSDHEGSAPLFTSEQRFDDGSIHEGLSTLYQDDVRNAPVGTIPLTTLDALRERERIDRLDVLKIDVEGAELDVLRGATETIRALEPWIVVEVNRGTSTAAGLQPEDILQFLDDLGYTFYRIDRHRPLSRLTLTTLGRFENVLARPRTRSATLLPD